MNAFKKVLAHGEDVELYMMCDNPFNSPEEDSTWRRIYNHPKVRYISRVDTQEEVYNIMRQVDCGIFPSRGEGWNLELLEMMSAGKHVIATNYSAHTEFCTEENCGLVQIKDVEPAFDNKWFFGQGNWAKIDAHVEMDLYMKMMRFILDKKNTINEAGIETANKFTWHNTAEKILNNV